MRFKSLLMDDAAIGRAITRISHEILERNKGTQDLLLLGILRRGMPLAEMIRNHIEKIEGVTLPCGALDIRYYRDDLTPEQEEPSVRLSPLPFKIQNKTVVLVDDVMYTGRTVRAAIDAVFSAGRPKRIQLAILIDRGHRELPVRADYVGKSIPTAKTEVVSVCVPQYDGRLAVELLQMDQPGDLAGNGQS
ncbi:MAG: bifunctional pyr operon transcriptional regulator/uracil phosphoribosyltransferase PyrR [Candidatus Limiplasma sp.]|nr:bifunctional pyr operon transcriptional regulator/uracil phosphoribosyltransferase PyrR [Candidatus Limiplasma sp.]MEA5145213.1 bifunctional pyr operon transcriptional regulator/uracil phosphoribosyltransferase PyrR [Candidatus Limiplasma sp.]